MTPPVTVLLFAQLRDLFAADAVPVAAATVAGVRAELARLRPAAGPLLARCRVAVNLDFADDGDAVTAADEVAVIPPVSGG